MIDKNFFTHNRKRLMEMIGANEIVVMTGYTAMQLSGDASAHFQQESNFWYLTGIDEPDWVVVITHAKTWLIAPSISAVHKVFDGSLSDRDAQRISGADEILDTESGRAQLDTLGKTHATVWSMGPDPYRDYYSFSLNPAPEAQFAQLKRQFTTVRDARSKLARLRAIKQPQEITAIEEAVQLTIDAFTKAREQLSTCRQEYQLEAVFTSLFRGSNAVHAYDPIVASGGNACTLHYIKNNAALQQGSLVLLDIGARVGGYSADITRTYAVGVVSQRQKEIHAVVQDAHKEIVSLLCPGLPFQEYDRRVDTIMQQALRTVGLLEVPDDYRRYFPHLVSHGLGVDVHDSLGDYKELTPGMVLTVEPGIYIAEESIGVRIEDDILITEDGCRNLSQMLSTSV